MNLTVEITREVDGRRIADIPEIPGAMAYGARREEAPERSIVPTTPLGYVRLRRKPRSASTLLGRFISRTWLGLHRLQAVRGFAAAALLAFASTILAQETDATLVEKPLASITDRTVSRLGEKALATRPELWKHGETKNFVYHFHSTAMAAPVASEAEFYYRTIAKELEKDTTRWERKGHIFIFEGDEEWHSFQGVGGLEPWTGGIHSQGELFIPRNPKRRFKGNALAHELTHLIVYRFFGAGVPLWLNEGLAEYSATRWYASYWRARGYNARPRSFATAPESYIPIAKLTSAVAYPIAESEVIAFYSESERLVRFLSAVDKHRFAEFLDTMSKGSRFESALDKSFGRRFFNSEALEKEFKPYAAKDYVEAP